MNFLSLYFLLDRQHISIANGNVSNFISTNRQIQNTPPLGFLQDINNLVMQHHSVANNVTTTGVTTISSSNPTIASIVQNPNVHVYPIYFFNIEVNGSPFGRILIEVRNDVAPKMAKNFGSLCTGKF